LFSYSYHAFKTINYFLKFKFNSKEITLSTDGDQTLTNFLHYRRERLIPQHPNDNAQLITGSSFDGGVVGKALKGSVW